MEIKLENEHLKEKNKILLVGGGGHCKSVLDSLLSLNLFSEIGIVDPSPGDAKSLLGVPVVGSDEDLPSLFANGWTNAFITLGSVGNPSRRRDLYDTLLKIGFRLPVIADATAVVSRFAMVGEGSYIGNRAVVNPGATIGVCAIINTGAIVEHDCTIGDFAHISPGAVLCGSVTIGQNTHLGAGAVVRQQIAVGSNALIGIGSVVVRNIPDHCEAFGNPCKVVKTR